MFFNRSLFCDRMSKSAVYNVDIWCRINPVLKDKILTWSKLKAFADNKLDVVEVMISIFDRVENTVEKGENADIWNRFNSVPKDKILALKAFADDKLDVVEMIY